MTLNNIMQYIESEYSIINNTHCKYCNGMFITEEIVVEVLNTGALDVFHCTCENCGAEKTFKFNAPFIGVPSQYKLN